MTLRYRIENYETMEGLFSQIKEATIKLRLNQRLWGLFVEMMQIIESVFGEIDEQEIFERIFRNEETCRRIIRILEDKEIADVA
jgi:hypothetical protein